MPTCPIIAGPVTYDDTYNTLLVLGLVRPQSDQELVWLAIKNQGSFKNKIK